MFIAMFLLPFFSVESYSIINNTTSQLGAQNAPHAWIMNVVFVLLGIFSIGAGWKVYKGYLLHRILLASFGISLILVAQYQHAPIDAAIEYDQPEDMLHSLFSNITGFSFTLLAISTSLILKYKTDRIIALAIGIAVTGLSILMFKFTDLMGIFQRIIFIVSFGWMIYVFRDEEKIKHDIQ
jgi:hypothetical membrane protein